MTLQKGRMENLWSEFDQLERRGIMNCEYCKREMHNRHLSFDGLRKTRDHYIPLSRGGTSAKENIRLACHRCNGIKGSMTPEEWEAYMAATPLWWTFTRWQRRHRAVGNPPLPLEESIMILRFGKKAWREWKARQSEPVSNSYKLGAPSGEEHIDRRPITHEEIKRTEELAKEHDWPVTNGHHGGEA